MGRWDALTATWASWRTRYEKVVEEYGSAALGTYVALFVATLIGFWVAIRSGVQVEGAAATAGTVGSAYIATKMTQPLRIAATVVLTPAWVRVVRRMRRPATPTPPPPAA